MINLSAYIDINAFMDKEIALLDSGNYNLLKYSKWNDQATTDTFTEVDWSKELALFKDVKVSLAGWRTDFELIDSTNDDGEKSLTFGALQPEQEVRLLHLVFATDGTLKRFNTDLRMENKLTKSERKMSYTCDKGFTIAGIRETKFMGEETYKVVCQLIKN